MGILDRLFSGKPTLEEFAKKVMTALEKGGARELQFDAAQNAIRVGPTDGTFYLANAFADYVAADRKARDGVIHRYVSSFLQHKPMPKDFASVKSFLMPTLKDPAFFSMAQLLMRVNGQDDSKFHTPTMPITGGLHASVAFDTENSIMNANQSSLDDWGVTFEEAFQVAILNLREKTDPNAIKQIAPGLFIGQWNDSYDSARMLLPDILHRLSLNGDPVVFVPNRDQLWVTGKYNKDGISAMLVHGKQSHFDQGHSLSPNLFLHTDGEWQTYLPLEEDLQKLAVGMRRQRDGLDYTQQKDYLDQLYKLRNVDIFVANCMLYKRKDESLFTGCAWTKGVESLLPETDVIAFVVDVEKKDKFIADWSLATQLVGHLLKPEPDLFPVRYRVTEFPTGDQLAQLREKSGGV